MRISHDYSALLHPSCVMYETYAKEVMTISSQSCLSQGDLWVSHIITVTSEVRLVF